MINSIEADINISTILNAPYESRKIEFKASFPWSSKIKDLKDNKKAQEVIQSILGISNIRDGGKIIVGVKEADDDKSDRFVAEGMLEDHLSTYDQDVIYQQVRNFGKPEPQFQILNIKHNSKFFIVFNIQSFPFSPVICNNYRNLEMLEMAALYIRTYKPETKRVTEPVEMREIVELAIEKELEVFSKRIQRILRGAPIQIAENHEGEYEKFNKELKDVL